MTFRKGTEKHTIVSVGPLTKYAEDLIPVIKALLGPEKSLEFKIGQEVPTLITYLVTYYMGVKFLLYLYFLSSVEKKNLINL